jgi:hypothetical protein
MDSYKIGRPFSRQVQDALSADDLLPQEVPAMWASDEYC